MTLSTLKASWAAEKATRGMYKRPELKAAATRGAFYAIRDFGSEPPAHYTQPESRAFARGYDAGLKEQA